MRNMAMVLLLLAGVAYPLVSAYHIEPVNARQSGWALGDENHGISQVLTINFDELDSVSGSYCELFAGSRGGGGAYHVSVNTYPGGVEIATGSHDGNVDHKWVRFNLHVTQPDSIVKGRKLEFRFTRGGEGGDSIQYYYDEDCGYGPYGQMIAPYPNPAQPGCGLAMRCLGRMRPVDSTDFGACEVSWYDKHGRRPNGDTMAARAKAANVNTVRLDIDWWLIQNAGSNRWDFRLFDSSMLSLDNDAGCRIVGVLLQPPWFLNGDATHFPSLSS